MQAGTVNANPPDVAFAESGDGALRADLTVTGLQPWNEAASSGREGSLQLLVPELGGLMTAP